MVLAHLWLKISFGLSLAMDLDYLYLWIIYGFGSAMVVSQVWL